MDEFLGVAQPLARALAARGYTQFTPVQEAVLQPELLDADLLVSAQTGSGKTVAFGMAMASTLLGDDDSLPKANRPMALVVAPTRELALQVKREIDWLYAQTGAVTASCVGGMDIRTERRALERGAHIVVGTPGRLRDHIMRKAFDTSELRAVVLDEADEMLDLGFREDLEFILEATPAERRTLLFSATVPAMIAKLAQRYQRDAVRVSTQQERVQHADIEYRALVVAPRERENAIINVLRFYEAENALVFCNTRASVNHMVARFNNRGFSVVALSGELSQNERTHALQALRDGRARVCIATDVAARGIDLPKLELVIHADLPSNPETLLHRSGRTGRAGRKGISALMVDVKGRSRAERLLRFAKLEAVWDNPPSADAVTQRDEERLLNDSILTDTPELEEAEFAARMLERFTPEQIATAFLRLNKEGKSAPEDIQKVSVHQPAKRKFEDRGHSGERPERKPREEFTDSVWVTLSVGRKQNAEPRWLIPLLCNGGDITKRDIGSIKIQQNETHVQLNAEQAEGFVNSVGPKLTLEKNVRVKVLDSPPDLKSDGPHKPGKRSFGKAGRGASEDAAGAGKKRFSKGKPGAKPDTKHGADKAKPAIGKADKADGGKKWAGKPKGAKPGASKSKSNVKGEGGGPEGKWAKKKTARKPAKKPRAPKSS